MNPGDNDRDIVATWRAASRDEPPAALDDAIRAAARRAVGAGPSRARHMRTWPLAAAAVMAVLAVGLLRERKLRLALAVLLRRLLERWRNADANPVDDDKRVHHGGNRRM